MIVTLIFKSCHLTNSIDVITPCRLTNCESYINHEKRFYIVYLIKINLINLLKIGNISKRNANFDINLHARRFVANVQQIYQVAKINTQPLQIPHTKFAPNLLLEQILCKSNFLVPLSIAVSSFQQPLVALSSSQQVLVLPLVPLLLLLEALSSSQQLLVALSSSQYCS